jgi:hypothetical protein
MRPAASKAPLEYLFANATCLFVLGMSFLVSPPATRYVVFSVGVVMTVSVLIASLWPVRD